MASAGTWQTQTLNGMQYLVLLPDGYQPGMQYPILMFLHGGNQASQMPGLVNPWFNTPDFRAAYPAIVVAPILPDGSQTGYFGGYNVGGVTALDSNTVAENNALAITQQVLTQYGADPNRVYLTGLSAGGYGTWDLMIKDNAYDGIQGRVFAAGLTLTGDEEGASYITEPGSPTLAVQAELQGVPIWAIGASATNILRWDQALAVLLPNSAYHYTQLTTVGEDTWDLTYPLPAGKPYYDWLFSQSANLQTAPATPVSPMAPTPPAASTQLSQEQAVARLYEAAFGRAADDAGLIANDHSTVNGVSLAQLGDSFAASPEFAARYGNPSNADFVAGLYQNALGRAGDAAGIQNWETALQNGLTRGGALADFAQSGESIALSEVNAGTVYAATAESQVARLYDTAFLRPPDAQGGASFATALLAGQSLQQAAASFINSTEFANDHGATLSNLGFVDLIYGNALNRAPDSAGEANFVQQLQTGQLSRAAVLVAISESPEHIYLMAHGV